MIKEFISNQDFIISELVVSSGEQDNEFEKQLQHLLFHKVWARFWTSFGQVFKHLFDFIIEYCSNRRNTQKTHQFLQADHENY